MDNMVEIIMSLEVETLFQQRNDSEIVKITPQEKEEVLKQAELFIHSKFTNLSFDGGELYSIDSAMIRSMVEFFAKEKALTCETGAIPRMDTETYQKALEGFKEYVNKTFESYGLLRQYWLSQVKLHVSKVFANSDKVFTKYMIGELGESFHLSNRFAEIVIKELEKDRFVKVIGRLYGEELLSRPV